MCDSLQDWVQSLSDSVLYPPLLPLPERDHVHILLIGKPDRVIQTIHDLYLCRFCDVHVWSRPLPAPDPQAIELQPGEIMRVYKRYLTL